MSRPQPIVLRRPGVTPLPRPALRSLSPTAVGMTTPAPGPLGPVAGCLGSDPGPTVAELAGIDAEGPVIEAEVALVDAECQHLLRPSPATRAAVRAAEAAVIRAHLAHLNRTRTTTAPIPSGDPT